MKSFSASLGFTNPIQIELCLFLGISQQGVFSEDLLLDVLCCILVLLSLALFSRVTGGKSRGSLA